MQSNSFWQGFWRLADPKISLASFAGMFMAALFATADGPLLGFWLALTVLGVFCVEIAKNAYGELVDFDSGTDQAITEDNRSPFSGGKRVMVDKLLSRNHTRAIATTFFTLAIVIGLYIVIERDVRVLGFGLVGMALAWSYHGGPARLAYRGLGELAVALAYGPVVVCGTYFVQTGAVNPLLVHLSMILGLLVAAFLWINEFPDYAADKAAGKNNLVVQLGRDTAVLLYALLLATGYAWLVICTFAYDMPQLLLGALGLPLAAFSVWRLSTSYAMTRDIIPAQAASLLGFVLMAVGCGVGYWFSIQ